MFRIIIGAALAAVAMLVVSYGAHHTPLAGIGAGKVANEQVAQLQGQLAVGLQKTGTYLVPDPNTAEQTGLYAQGPVATLHYNEKGISNSNMGAMRYLYALVLNFLVALTIGAALLGLDRQVENFGARARLVLLLAFGASAFVHLSRPIWQMHDWGNALFDFIGDGLAIALGGLIVAWFTPRLRSRAPRDAPTDV